MKLSMKFRGLETTMLYVMAAALKDYNVTMTENNGVVTIEGDISDKDYVEIMCMVTCFGPEDVKLS